MADTLKCVVTASRIITDNRDGPCLYTTRTTPVQDASLGKRHLKRAGNDKRKLWECEQAENSYQYRSHISKLIPEV